MYGHRFNILELKTNENGGNWTFLTKIRSLCLNGGISNVLIRDHQTYWIVPIIANNKDGTIKFVYKHITFTMIEDLKNLRVEADAPLVNQFGFFPVMWNYFIPQNELANKFGKGV